MKKLQTLFIIILQLVFALVLIKPTLVIAWGQGDKYYAHESINKKAFQLFKESYYLGPKYKNAEIDFNQRYLGPFVISSSTFLKDHVVKYEEKNIETWIVHGGYSADEPHLWASVKHFYDPISRYDNDRKPELTDHEALFKTASYVIAGIDTAISAKYWAISAGENPFSWYNALRYYKDSMEVPNDWPETVGVHETNINFSDHIEVTLVSDNDYFIRNPMIEADSPDQMRKIYLAKSFRALGETMHLLADMTQPAHVRNDSHPTGNTDPLEEAVTSQSGMIKRAMRNEVYSGIKEKIDGAANLSELWEIVAEFTNTNFYSNDTIHNVDFRIMPNNGEKPYPEPQFSDMILDVPNRNGIEQHIYVKKFDGVMVKMIQETLTSYEIRTNYKYSDLRGDLSLTRPTQPFLFSVPKAFCESQANVLLPAAAKANSRLIDLFFPTMELQVEVEKMGVGNGNQTYQIESTFRHLIENDPEWRAQGLEIFYSGPAELWRERNGSTKLVRDDLYFYKGQYVDEITDILYFTITTDTSSASDFQPGDSFFIKIRAGGRIFDSDPYPLQDDFNLYINPHPDILNGKGTINSEYLFVALGDGIPGNAIYHWSTIEKGNEISHSHVPGENIYITFSESGKYIIKCFATWTETLPDGKSIENTVTADPVAFTILESKITLTPNKINGEVGQSYTFTASIDNVPKESNFNWYVNGQFMSSGIGSKQSSESFTFNQEGNYIITVELVSGGIAVASADATANIGKAQSSPQQEQKPPPAITGAPEGWESCSGVIPNLDYSSLKKVDNGKQVYYVDGKNQIQGVYTEYWDSAKTKLYSRKCYVNGVIEGIVTTWYENGNIHYENPVSQNKTHGIYKEWWPNGNLMKEVTYVNNSPNGHSVYYYSNGNKEKEGNHVNGSAKGEWIYYNEDGSFKYRVNQ